ncbi:MFS transporter [Macrococcoides bohemicum]|uniref:MFS transporter n=1 Tax=Macrococcoides bohemicum TaxID=1903056 RepID=UPI001C5E348A|nr:MFS transporter [Macrococcus bohemicus]QYA45079.1 MFS transporter [Macrococcus bohemicus]
MRINYLMFTVLLATFLEKYCYYLIMPVLLVFLTTDFNLTGTQIGIALSLNGLSKIVMSLLNAKIINKVPKQWIIYAGLMITIISYFSFPFIDTYIGVLIFSFFSSLGFSMLTPVYKLLISTNATDNKKLLFNIRYYVINIAAALGPLSAGLLIFIKPEQLFFVVAIILLINLCSFLICFRKYPQIESNDVSTTTNEYRIDKIPVIFFLLLIAMIFFSFAYNQLNSGLPIYLSQIFTYKQSVQYYSTLLFVNSVTVLLGQYFVYQLSNHIKSQYLLIIGSILMTLSILLFGFSQAIIILCLIMILFTFGEMIVMTVQDIRIDEIASDQMKGRLYSLMELESIGKLTAPLIGGYIIDTFKTGQDIFMMLSIIASFSVLFFILGLKSSKRKESISK